MRSVSRSLLLAAVLLCPTAYAQVHEVKMLTRGAAGSMVYEPDYLQVAPGDTVRFIPAQSGHNAASVSELLPAGAQAFQGKINQVVEQVFQVPGLYGIQCTPHLAMGMVMLIQVGEPAAQPPELPSALPPRALERLNSILQR